MKTKQLLKRGWLVVLIGLVALNCNKNNEVPMAPEGNGPGGTFTVDAQLKKEIKINLSGKDFALDEILTGTEVVVNDTDGQEVWRANYADLTGPVSLPAGDYALLATREGNPVPNFDDPTYVNSDYSSGGTRFTVEANANTAIDISLVLDHVKVVIDFSDEVVQAYPDITVDVLDPNPTDNTLESEKLTWSVAEDGQSGYIYIDGEAENLVVNLSATDPDTGQAVTGTKTYTGVTKNQRYQLAIELGAVEENGTFSITPSLEPETSIDDIIVFGNNEVTVQSDDYEILKLLYNSNPGNTLGWDLSETTMESWGESVKLDVNGRVTELLVRGRNLPTIPSELGNLSKLQVLELTSNKLSSVPAELGNLSNLRVLMLGQNELSSVPAELGNLANLQVLNLGLNDLLSVPAELANLTNLRELYLNDSPLERIPPELGRLINLEVLFLEKNQLTEVPPELGNLTKLLYLDLDENRLSGIPSELGNLTNLKELDLHDNQLTEIPPELGNLVNLNRLYLNENLLTEIPSELGNLKNLTNLDVTSNPVRRIPQTVCDLFGGMGELYGVPFGFRFDEGFGSKYERDFCE